jgi:predicted NUDIX family NTP pyrophosphohydrolase
VYRVLLSHPRRPFSIRDVDGRTSVVFGEPGAGGNALILTEDFDDLIALAMHFRPQA